MCPKCHSFEWDTIAASGRGAIYSYVVHHHPALPGIPTPSPVVLVELEEGVRTLGNLVDGTADDLRIGVPVEMSIRTDPGDDMFLVQWRPALAPA